MDVGPMGTHTQFPADGVAAGNTDSPSTYRGKRPETCDSPVHRPSEQIERPIPINLRLFWECSLDSACALSAALCRLDAGVQQPLTKLGSNTLDASTMDFAIRMSMKHYRWGCIDFVGKHMNDADKHLVEQIRPGIVTGFREPIPASGIWLPKALNADALDPVPLESFDSNWTSAERDPEKALKLV